MCCCAISLGRPPRVDKCVDGSHARVRARARARPKIRFARDAVDRAAQVGLLFPPQEALEDDEHPWWYMTAR